MNSFSELLKATLCLEAICRTARGTQMALCKAVVEPYVFTCGYSLMMKDNKWLSDSQEEELKKIFGYCLCYDRMEDRKRTSKGDTVLFIFQKEMGFLFDDDDRDILLVIIKSKVDEDVPFYDTIIKFVKSVDWKIYKSSSTGKMKITVKNLKFEDILERKGLSCIK